MINGEESFDEKVKHLRDEIRDTRGVTQTPRILSIVEEMLWLIVAQQQAIEKLQRDCHFHYDPNNPDHVQRVGKR